jgi:hypothetical protein
MKPSFIWAAALVMALLQPPCISLSAETGAPNQSGAGAIAATPMFLIVQDGKWGLIDATGKVVIEPKYDQLGGIQDENPFFQRLPPAERGKAMFLDVMHPSGKSALIPFCQKGLCGVVAPGGTEVIPPRYENVRGGFEDGRLAVRRGGLWGFVNEAGSEVIAPKFLDACMFHGGVAMVQIAAKQWTLIDVDGHSLIDPPWTEQPIDSCQLSDEPLTRATQDGRWGFLDRSGHWAIPPTFERVGSFHDGLASARRNGKWGFIGASGSWVIDPTFDDVDEFGCPSNDSAIVRVGDQSGVINRAGEVLFLLPGRIQCTQGPLLVYVKYGLSKYGTLLTGLIDRTGHVVVESKYASFSDKYPGMYQAVLAVGSGQYEYVYFDSAGHVLSNVTNDLAFKDFHEGLAIYQSPSGKRGFIDETGRVVIEAVYDRAFDYEDGLARVVQGDRVSYIDHAGHVVYAMLFR